MITLSLNEIREQSPCKSCWETLLKSKQNTHWEEQFPLSDIIDSNGFSDTLWCLRARPEHSKLWRKYAVWCARQVEHLMTDERSKAALEVAWRHSEGNATDEELAAAVAAARNAAWAAAGVAAARNAAWAAAGVAAARNAAWAAEWAAADASERAAADAAWLAARNAALAAAYAARAAGYAARDAARAARDAALAEQEKKLREILKAGEWR